MAIKPKTSVYAKSTTKTQKSEKNHYFQMSLAIFFTMQLVMKYANKVVKTQFQFSTLTTRKRQVEKGRSRSTTRKRQDLQKSSLSMIDVDH